MAGYKLYYFDIRGRGETARMLFKIGGRRFEDIRIKQQEWPEFKEKAPLGQLPYLEFDGKQLAQSLTIYRFLAKKFSLAGKSVLEEAFADMVVDTVMDAPIKAEPIFSAKDEEEKERAKEELSVSAQAVLEKVEALLEKNNGGDGFFVGDALTWADVGVYNTIEFCAGVCGVDLWSKFPKLKAFKERFEEVPKIAEYLSTRPDAPF